MITFKPKRERSRVFAAGDSKLWQSSCGQFRLRLVRRVAGCRVRPHWQAVRLVLVNVALRGPLPMWELISRHRKRSAAEAAIERESRRLTAAPQGRPRKRSV